jgi:nucleoside 2-deoxyribosyltransferase
MIHDPASGMDLDDVDPNQFVVYLAGKVWPRGEESKWAIAQRVDDQLACSLNFIASDGYKGHGRHDADVYVSRLGELRQDDRNWTRQHCIAALHRADMLFAWLDTSDSFGSIAELAYFSALGKPVLIAALTVPEPNKTDENDDADNDPVVTFNREMFDAYWLCSCFPGVVLQPVSCAAAAANVLAGFIEGLQVGVNRRALASAALQRLHK